VKKVQPLSTYQRGALCFLAIRKKARTDPLYTSLMNPHTFVTSDSWQKRKRDWGYGRADIREFLRGFYDASNVKAGPRDNLA